MIKAILTDIEGTTTSLSFVKDVLFPYADQHIAEFVTQYANRPEIASLLEQACQEPEAACDADDLASVIKQLRTWIATDKKVTPLKALQGLLWENAYQQGDFTGHIYPDAASVLRQWHEQGLKLYVYSSGSVKAQHLLFHYSDFGDLTALFSGYFDTKVGHKRESASYQTIAKLINSEPESILFLSDIHEELDAAAQAGLKTCCLVRENQSLLGLTHTWVSDFTHINLNNY